MSNEFQHKGRNFRLEIEQDPYYGEPWKESDVHGPVSEWTYRDKLPGEWVLCEDRQSKRYYDFAEAMRIAKKDGWDAEPYGGGSKGEKAYRAVKADFEYLRGWCNDQWVYAVLNVALLDEDGEQVGTSLLGGIEWYYRVSDYIMDTAKELADELLAEVVEEEKKERIANRFKEAMECGI